jgi:16S rRNA (adenine1518-N6/adenine1519-N6)-dimethyltransferase
MGPPRRRSSTSSLYAKRLPSPFYASRKRKRGTAPFSRKRFGQHFLEPVWVAKVVQAIDPRQTDHFLEIGPGRGALTGPLLERVTSVQAFEIDRDLAAGLRGGVDSTYGLTTSKLTLVEGDFLETANSLAGAPSHPLRVAGNLPYNVASPILFKLLELHASGVPLVDATLMLQHEVADRLVAGPGGKEYGVLSILVQHTADVERLLSLPPGAFRPPPQVRSALVRVRFREPRPPADDQKTFAALVQAIFTRRRKTLANALLAFHLSSRLSPGAALERAALDGRRRPETLTVAELVRLGNVFSSVSG